MKKILLITENIGSGGAERQLTGLAVMLKKEGYQIKFITYIEKQFFLPVLMTNNIDYKLVKKAGNKYLRLYYLFLELKKFRPDIVISFLPSSNLAMCTLKLLYRSKLIISERSYTLNFDLVRKIKFFIYRNSDCIITNSKAECINIKSHFPRLANKILAIPNYVDTQVFTPLYGRNNAECINILCVGRIIDSKNVLNLVQAIKLVIEKKVNIRVKWVGSMYDTKYCNLVKVRINEYEMDNYFTLYDHTEDLLDEYQKADIFCLPSFYEGYPNVICEAMSCELPVICSNVCENPNIVKEGRNGFLFDPMNVQGMADSIIKMVSLSYYERIAIGKQNRIDVLNNNSIESFVSSYIKLF